MGLWGATAVQMSPHPAYRRGLAAQLWRVMQLCWLVCTVFLGDTHTRPATFLRTFQDLVLYVITSWSSQSTHPPRRARAGE
jgi:hypothetical protein